MNSKREKSIRQLLSELTLDSINVQAYIDDIDPRCFYDTYLCGKFTALVGYLEILKRPDLKDAVNLFLPLDGNAIEALTFVSDHVCPEVLDMLNEQEIQEVKISINPNVEPVMMSNNTWDQINTEFNVSKRKFGKLINFVKDPYKRSIIFRDVEQAYELAQKGMSKPAVILAGGVVEELLRLYLEHIGEKSIGTTFNDYIKKCESRGILKSAVHSLADSTRHFRNMVHLKNENTKCDTVSPSVAKGAVSSIFTLVNSFGS